jgi:uncharacterized OsmC-like protein
MSTLRIHYDGVQHCTAYQEPQGKTVASDACTATGGKGEEFSPVNLVGTGLSSCMLFAMGMIALRNDIDLTGTQVDIEISSVDKPVSRIGEIQLKVMFPKKFSEEDRLKLERAADACPIKHSFHPEVKISTVFISPDETVSAAPEKEVEQVL